MRILTGQMGLPLGVKGHRPEYLCLVNEDFDPSTTPFGVMFSRSPEYLCLVNEDFDQPRITLGKAVDIPRIPMPRELGF